MPAETPTYEPSSGTSLEILPGVTSGEGGNVTSSANHNVFPPTQRCEKSTLSYPVCSPSDQRLPPTMQSRPGNVMIASYQTAIPNYTTVGDVPLPGALITKTFDRIKTFDVRPDDVIIAGYPRSGNHWLKEIVTQLYVDELGNTSKHVYERIPILEVAVDIPACMKTYVDKHYSNYGVLKPIVRSLAATIGLRNSEKFFNKGIAV